MSDNDKATKTQAEATPRRAIFVVSDATGNTAEQMVRAALVQFEIQTPRLRIWPRVRTPREIDEIVTSATRRPTLIVHTLVNPQLSMQLHQRCEASDVLCIDLIGPLLNQLGTYLHARPRGRPGSGATLDDSYFRRVDALEFTVNQDDGRSPERLRRADIVLVGVSRTSKTPVATYLAGRGYKVANVPIVKGLQPPRELDALPRGRVFALTIDPGKLAEIRSRRMLELGVREKGAYSDFDHVLEELRDAHALYRSKGWPIINVTNQAIEETASQILRLHARHES